MPEVDSETSAYNDNQTNSQKKKNQQTYSEPSSAEDAMQAKLRQQTNPIELSELESCT